VELWQALILGLVEGLTEFLPVSSTGHLLVVQRLLGIPSSEAANAYAIVIQAGAIAAVLGLYRRRIAQMALGLTGREPAGARLLFALAVAFLPAAVAGLAFDEAIERYLFGSWPVVAAWVIGGIGLLVLGPRLRGRQGSELETITWRIALVVGVAQCAALWPGVSRSLATILGGLAVGLSLAAAVEFSFLLGVLTLSAATAYKLLDSGRAMLDAYGMAELICGFVVAWLAAILAVKWMLAWLNQRGLAIFGWWRLTAAAIVAALLLSGHLEEQTPGGGRAPRSPLEQEELLLPTEELLRPTIRHEGSSPRQLAAQIGHAR
jgi:undecaprenyl-diphosphatase